MTTHLFAQIAVMLITILMAVHAWTTGIVGRLAVYVIVLTLTMFVDVDADTAALAAILSAFTYGLMVERVE